MITIVTIVSNLNLWHCESSGKFSWTNEFPINMNRNYINENKINSKYSRMLTHRLFAIRANEVGNLKRIRVYTTVKYIN